MCSSWSRSKECKRSAPVLVMPRAMNIGRCLWILPSSHLPILSILTASQDGSPLSETVCCSTISTARYNFDCEPKPFGRTRGAEKTAASLRRQGPSPPYTPLAPTRPASWLLKDLERRMACTPTPTETQYATILSDSSTTTYTDSVSTIAAVVATVTTLSCSPTVGPGRDSSGCVNVEVPAVTTIDGA